MNKQEFLKSIRKQIHFVIDRNSIEQEFNQHIEDSVLDLMEEGYSMEEAERISVERMGNPIEIGKQLNEEHHPLLGYLWVVSRATLCLLVIPAIIMVLSFGYNLFQLATPTTVEDTETIINLGIEFDIDTHHVIIDNICKKNEDEYMITYRGFKDYSYSRAGWSTSYFLIENEIGEYWETGGIQSNGFIGSIGYKEFKWPKDGVLNIKTETNEIISINLKEYDYEPK